MPVLRKREEIRSNAGRGQGVVGAPQDRSGALLMEQAANFQRRANEVGRAMATAADEEGKALAKAAVFSTSENGVPVMPPEVKERMGSIARQSMNASLEEKYAHQLTSAIKAQINDAEAANQFDREAFTQDANDRLAEMAGDIPEEMQGMFQQISTGLMVDANAGIGMRQGRLEIADATSRVPVQVNDAINTIKQRIIMGADVAAQAQVGNALAMIDGQPVSVMDSGAKRDAKNKLLIETGSARMLRDLGLTEDSVTPDELFDLATRLRTGEDAELMEYFTHEGSDTPSFELARNAADRVVMPLVSSAKVNTSRRKARSRAQGNAAYVASGAASGTDKERETLDSLVTADLAWTDETGRQVAITPEAWGGMAAEDRAIAIRRVKDANFLPETLKGFFRQTQAKMDADSLEDAFLVYRDLQGVPNSEGEVNDLSGEIPAALQQIFARIDAEHGDGESNQESVSVAVQSFLNTRDGAEELDDKSLARRMNGDNGWMDGRGSVTEDNAAEEMRRAVTREVFDGIEATEKEKTQATVLFRNYYEQGHHTFDEALDYVRSSMEGRFRETKFMNVARSSAAPEKHYPDPPAGGLGEMLLRADRKVAGALIQSVPGFETVWNVLMPTRMTEVDSSRLRASRFELMADVAVRDMVEAMGDDAPPGLLDGDGAFIFDKMLVGGEDYVLTTSSRTGKTPIYNVSMLDGDGKIVPLGELDLRDEWDDMTRADRDAREVQAFLDDRENVVKIEKWRAAAPDLFKDGPVDADEAMQMQAFLMRLLDENPDIAVSDLVDRGLEMQR